MDPPPIQPHPQSLDASDSAPLPVPLSLSPVSDPRAPLPRRRPPLPTPRVYRVHPSGFRKLVQRLTGAPSSPQSPSSSAALLITNNDDNAVHINAHDQSGSSSKYSNWWPHNNAMLSPGTMESTEHRNYGCYDHDDNKSI